MDASQYFLAGLARPFVLLLFWVPLVAVVLWLVRRYLPRWERVLFWRVTGRNLAQVARRLFRRAA